MSDRDRDQSVEGWLRRLPAGATPNRQLPGRGYARGVVRRSARRRGPILRRIARIDVRALPGDACGHGPDDPSAGVGHSFADPQVAHVARTGAGRSCRRRAVVRRRSQREKHTVGPRRTEQGARGVRSRNGACARTGSVARARGQGSLLQAPRFSRRCCTGGPDECAAAGRACRRRSTAGAVQREEGGIGEIRSGFDRGGEACGDDSLGRTLRGSGTSTSTATASGGASARGTGSCKRRAREHRWRCELAVSQPVSERSGAKSPGARQSSAEQSSPEQSGAASEPGSEPAAAATAGSRGARRGRRLARISRGREEGRRCAGRVRWFSPRCRRARDSNAGSGRSLARRRWPSRATVPRRRSDLGRSVPGRRGRDSDGRRGAVDDRVLARRPCRRHRSHDRRTRLAACAVSRTSGLHGRRRRRCADRHRYSCRRPAVRDDGRRDDLDATVETIHYAVTTLRRNTMGTMTRCLRSILGFFVFIESSCSS